MTTFLGNPVTLEGASPALGEVFPDFVVTATDLSEVRPMDEPGTKIFLAVPSVDTDVCSLELVKFKNAVNGQDKVKVYSISMDTPFALNRWNQDKENDQIISTSDFKDRSFAQASGTRMAENGLLARSVFVVDEDGKLIHKEIVEEVANEPDYKAALSAAGV